MSVRGHEHLPLAQFVETLPAGVLIAGHPKYMDDVPILARRSVLCNYKLAHPWYSTYYEEVRRRTEATFEAIYATDATAINRLAEEWGVTHLVVVRRHLDPRRLRAGPIYVKPYEKRIRRLARRPGLMLVDPPRDRVVYSNERLFVLELPLPVVTAEPASRPASDPAADEPATTVPRG